MNSGFVNIKCSQNGVIHKKMARLCLEEFGDAFHAFVLGQTYFPIHMALKFNIQLIFYGENGELEYAGDPKLVDKPDVNLTENKKLDKRIFKRNYIKRISGIWQK